MRTKSAGRLLTEAAIVEAHPKLIKALKRMLSAHEALMPGLKYISVRDYALQNDAPVEAKRLLAEFRG